MQKHTLAVGAVGLATIAMTLVSCSSGAGGSSSPPSSSASLATSASSASSAGGSDSAASSGTSSSASAGSGASTAASGVTATAPNDLSASITYAIWDQTQVPGIKANLAGFNKQYPKVHVNIDVTPYATYWTKLQTEASSNTLPDLFWLNGPNAELYESSGKVEPITGEVNAGLIDPKNYPANLDKLYAYDGIQYGVPKDFDTIGVWVNKSIFKEAGVPLPTNDWTWSQFESIAKKISDKLKSKGIYGVAAGMDGQTTYYPTIFQAGGDVISADGTTSGYDKPATEKGIQFWTNLIADGSSPSIQQLTDTPADQWFVSGKVAMYQGGDWARTEIKSSPIAKDVQVYELPAGKEKANVIHGLSNVVASNSKNKKAAQALQVYLASRAAQQQQGKVGTIIPAFNGTQQAFVNSWPGVDLKVFIDQVQYAKPFPISKNTAVWNAYESALLPKAFAGQQPVNKICVELAKKMNAALAKE